MNLTEELRRNISKFRPLFFNSNGGEEERGSEEEVIISWDNVEQLGES